MFYVRDLYPNMGTISTGTKTLPDPYEGRAYLGANRGRIAPSPSLDPEARWGVSLSLIVLVMLIGILAWSK